MRRRFMNSKSFDENNYLTFVCLEDNSTIMFTKEIYYSINGSVWNKLYLNTPLKVTVGMHISFKENFREIDTVYGIGYFITEGKFNILGNVNSLIFGDNAKNQTDISSYKGVFTNLFIRNTSIIDASLLKLPATTLASSCYDSMFQGCTSLTTAPSILPATTLASNCYQCMFNGCTGLTTAPELPATTLANYCYYYMFYYCTSLTTAPALPATTLAKYCYQYMFYGCTKLNYIKMFATDISAHFCLNGWVNGVASTGTFVKNPTMTTLPTGAGGIPSGWTVVNDGEESGGVNYTIENGEYYPDLVKYLENKYGFGFGSTYNPIAIEENIFIGNSFAAVGTGKVKFLCIGSEPTTRGIKLYLENHKKTYECVALWNLVDSPFYGQATAYFYD